MSEQAGLAGERTALAWNRTALAGAVTATFVVRWGLVRDEWLLTASGVVLLVGAGLTTLEARRRRRRIDLAAGTSPVVDPPAMAVLSGLVVGAALVVLAALVIVVA